MTSDVEMSGQPLFRANKRRKIYRKRDIGEGQSMAVVEDAAESSVARTASPSSDEASATSLPIVRKPALRRNGIGFSSSDRQRADGQGGGNESALVPVTTDQTGDNVQINRFVRPTGQVGVVEDKHLTKFIDSRLAEMRTASATAATERINPKVADVDAAGEDPCLPSATRAAGPQANKSAAPKAARQPPSTTPKKPSRRGPKPRDPSSLARDSLVDQILSESQTPMYTATPNSEIHSSTTAATAGDGLDDDNDNDSNPVDNDEAAAEAFKAAFLADLQLQNNRRRQPAPPTSSAAKKTQSSGPKLGGSRSQRGKMRAAELAKKERGGLGGKA